MRPRQESLEVEAATSGYPRTAAGEFGAWQGGYCFATWQAEWHKLDGRHSSIYAQFGIVALEDCTWLSGIFVWDERHATRQEALRAAGEEVIERVTHLATPWTNGGYTHPARITFAEANAIIAWASEVIGSEPVLLTQKETPKAKPAWSDLPLFANTQ